jgi:hypothetical protein
MAAKISIDDEILQRLQKEGELQVEDTSGMPVVLMTFEAREKLKELIYDDSEWTEEDLRSAAANLLNDPEGWGAPGMEIYDEIYGDEFAGGDNSE